MRKSSKPIPGLPRLTPSPGFPGLPRASWGPEINQNKQTTFFTKIENFREVRKSGSIDRGKNNRGNQPKPLETFRKPPETFQKLPETFRKPPETFRNPLETSGNSPELSGTLRKPPETLPKPPETSGNFRKPLETHRTPRRKPRQNRSEFSPARARNLLVVRVQNTASSSKSL